MRTTAFFNRRLGIALLSLAVPTAAVAQSGQSATAPATRVSMADAVRLALEHNHQLRADRLNVDLSKAGEITAALKPNPVINSTNQDFPVFSPSDMTWDNFANNQTFTQSLSYLFERGGKREKRTLVAKDATSVAAKTAADLERQLIFGTRQAFINVLLAKSTLDLARDNLANFSTVVNVNRERMRAGDLAESDFLKIALQQLQFEQDLTAAEIGLVLAKTMLRQGVGFEGLADEFEVDGDLAYMKYPLTLDDLKRDALEARPDLLAALDNVKLAEDTQLLALSNRTRDLTAEVEYDRDGSLNALGFGLSIELPFHDRNQGNIAQSKVAVRQAGELQAQARTVVLTDVTNAFAALQNSEKVILLFQSGYLSQAQQSLEVTTYVYQRGGGTLLDLLDAERTNRTIQLAYRQALAAYMTSAQQINLAVGRQVVP